MEATLSVTPADLLPPQWGKTAESIDRVVWIGSHNIRAAIRFSRSHVEAIEAQTKRAREQYLLFRHLTPESLKAIAKEYSNPKPDMTPSATLSNGQRVPAPDPEMLLLPAGSTTFNLCGWCSYARGERRPDLGAVFLNSQCEIRVNAGFEEPVLRFFYTPCLLVTHFPGELFGRISDQLASAPDRLGKLKGAAEERVRLLLALEKLAIPKPVFPIARPADWYHAKVDQYGSSVESDPAVLYLTPDQHRRIKDDAWRHGEVVEVTKQHVTFRTGGILLPSFHSNPWLLKPWELDYLAGHGQYLDDWAGQADLNEHDREYLMSVIKSGNRLK
jgi:hypothetical protein